MALHVPTPDDYRVASGLADARLIEQPHVTAITTEIDCHCHVRPQDHGDRIEPKGSGNGRAAYWSIVPPVVVTGGESTITGVTLTNMSEPDPDFPDDTYDVPDYVSPGPTRSTRYKMITPDAYAKAIDDAREQGRREANKALEHALVAYMVPAGATSDELYAEAKRALTMTHDTLGLYDSGNPMIDPSDVDRLTEPESTRDALRAELHALAARIGGMEQVIREAVRMLEHGDVATLLTRALAGQNSVIDATNDAPISAQEQIPIDVHPRGLDRLMADIRALPQSYTMTPGQWEQIQVLGDHVESNRSTFGNLIADMFAHWILDVAEANPLVREMDR